MIKNVYQKYCNDIQNPALGAAIISIFVNTFNKSSINKEYPSLLMVFVIIPLILNENYRQLLINSKGNKSSNGILTFLSKIVKKEFTANNLHHYVEIFKSYTLTSIVFAINTGLIKIDSKNGTILPFSEKIEKFPVDNLYLKAAKILGDYFSNGITLKLLQQKLEVLF